MKFDRCGDVKLYLVNSIVMYDGKPATVLKADDIGGGEFEILLVRLDRGKKIRVRTDDSLLELEPPKLGYINAGGKAVYLHRDPVRYYKRGLSSENVRNQYFSSDAVTTIANDDYPSFSTAMDSIEHSMVSSCAFSCNFAVDKKGLYFKKRKVGKVVDGKATLDKKFSFLSNKLEESIRD